MYVQEIVEEIIEKLPQNTTPVPLILRKVTQVRDRLLRNSTIAQSQSDVICVAFDIFAGKGQYQLHCPPGNITEVTIRHSVFDNSLPNNDAGDWQRLPLKSFNERTHRPYYYFIAGKIGIWPEPLYDTSQGLKIFNTETLGPLTINDLEGQSGFDPDFDMLLVYGALKEIEPNNASFENRYQQIYAEYQNANSGYERHVVKERW